jgi:hypothetical protein
VSEDRGQPSTTLEFTVTDQSAAPPVRRRHHERGGWQSGRIRTNAEVFRKNTAPTVVALRRYISEIEARIGCRRRSNTGSGRPQRAPAGKTSITQSVTAILNDGVSTILSQSADPLTDRKVTLEVKATIIK